MLEVMQLNCRRVSDLLSAYLDAELTGVQMLEIGEHLDKCAACRKEYAGLRETKHLLGALAMQTPRCEFDALLRTQCEEATRPPAERLKEWAAAWRSGATTLPRPHPLVAAAGLSLGAILLATSSVGVPRETADIAAVSAPAPAYSPVLQSAAFPGSMPMIQPVSLILTSNTSVVWPVSEPQYPYSPTQWTSGTRR